VTEDDRLVLDHVGQRLGRGRGDGEIAVVVRGGEAVGDVGQRRLVTLGVLLVVDDLDARLLEGLLEPGGDGVERGMGLDQGDADLVGLVPALRITACPGVGA